MKKIKRALAVFLATLTLVVSVLTMHVQSVQAVAFVDDIAALYYAAVYAASAAANYNVTKHQNTEMTNEIASSVNNYFKYIRGSVKLSELATLDKAAWLELAVDKTASELEKSISKKISEYVWGDSAEQMTRDEIYSRLDDAEADFGVLEGSSSVAGSSVKTSGISAVLKVPFFRLIKDIVKSCIELKNKIPDSQKSLYDWQGFGLDTDCKIFQTTTSLDALAASYNDISYFKNGFSEYSNKTIMTFNYSYEGSMYIGSIVFKPDTVSDNNVIWLSLKNPVSGLYDSYFLDDESVFTFLSMYKAGQIEDLYTYFHDYCTSKYDDYMFYYDYQFSNSSCLISMFDVSSLESYRDFSYSWDAGYKGILKSNNSTLSDALPFRLNVELFRSWNHGDVICDSDNTLVYGLGYSMDYMRIDSYSPDAIEGIFSSKNGEFKAPIAKSQVSGLDEALDAKSNVLIDPKIVTKEDSDHSIKTIAQDNDIADKVDTTSLDTDKSLDSDVGRVTVDENGEPVVTKSVGGILKYVGDIWKKIKTLPQDIYNFFSGALSTIASNIKTLPARITTALSSKFDSVIEAITSSPAAIYELINQPLLAISEALNPLPEILEAIEGLEIPVLSDVVAAIEAIDIGSIVDAVTSLSIPNVADIAKGIDIAGVIEAIKTFDLSAVIEAITGIDIAGVIEAIKAIDIPGVIEAVTGIDIAGVIEAIKAIDIPGVIEAVTGIDIAGVIEAIKAIDIPGVIDIADAIADVLALIFIPDLTAIELKITELKSHFEFVTDFKEIINKFVDDAFEPHDYITIPNIDKANNKYDKRDSYTISFAWYAPYKQYVDGILIAFIYLAFIWRIFMKLPGIISGTAGEFGNVDSMGADIANGSRSSGKGGGD